MIKVLQSISFFDHFVKNSLSGISAILNLLFVIFVVILHFAIIAKQLYGGLVPADMSTRDNFDRLPSGMITFFKIMTADNWLDIVYYYMDVDYTSVGKGSLYYWTSPIILIFFYFLSPCKYFVYS
jgi:hypothetical protein